MQIHNARYDLVTTWCGGMASRTSCQSFSTDKSPQVLHNHTIDSDEPVALGGSGFAAGPQELMLAAFNACMTVVFVQEAKCEDINLTHLEIQTCGQLLTGLSISHEAVPGRLQYVIRVSGNATVRQFEQLHQRVISASLNRWLLAQNMLVEGDLILIG